MKVKPSNKPGKVLVEEDVRESALPQAPEHKLSSVRLKRILVPLDFSEQSKEALRYARPFAEEFEARVILLHVVETPFYPVEVGYTPVEMPWLEENLINEARTRLEVVAEKELQAAFPVETIVRTGKPYQVINDVARELEADLVVLSTHGYTGFKHVLLGSTAERVIRHAHCPVMVVRRPEAKTTETTEEEGKA